MGAKSLALSFHVKAECNVSRARAGLMKLPHYEVKTPVFMPVGTQVRMITINSTVFSSSFQPKDHDGWIL